MLLRALGRAPIGPIAMRRWPSLLARTPAARGFTSGHGGGGGGRGESREAYLQHLGGDDQGVSVLVLDRPHARNALGRDMVQDLAWALAELEARAGPGGTRCLVVRSEVPAVFSAGADLKERDGMSDEDVVKSVRTLRSAFRQLELLPVPTIAAVDGAAYGGGMELAMACDLRVAGAGAKFALPETGLAIIPGAGGTQRLPRLVGIPVAKELIYTGRAVGHEEALSHGLVNAAVPEGVAATHALDMARVIARKGPVALRMAKAAIDRGCELNLDSGLSVEEACYNSAMRTRDMREGLAALSEKRAPVYTGE